MKKGDTGYIVYDKIVWSVSITATGSEKTRIDWYETRNVTFPTGQKYERNRPTLSEVPTSKVFSKKSLAAKEALRQIQAEVERLLKLNNETAALVILSQLEEGQGETVQQQAA